jgi:hypothetical protein
LGFGTQQDKEAVEKRFQLALENEILNGCEWLMKEDLPEYHVDIQTSARSFCPFKGNKAIKLYSSHKSSSQDVVYPENHTVQIINSI